MPRIDFNCDLGEGCGDDAAIMPWISSANIACGAHAGDEDTIRATLRLCRSHGVAAGAHPGYADREHFGRRELILSARELSASLHEQLLRIATIAVEEAVALTHVKPHGALYNLCARDPGTARIVAETVRDFDPGLILVGLSGSHATRAGADAGLRVAHEVFAERGYGSDGLLLPRGVAGATIEHIDAAVTQSLHLACEGAVVTADGRRLRLRADTLCLHGDRADAARFAQTLRHALENAGVRILPLGEPG